jgi:hypothetical protein
MEEYVKINAQRYALEGIRNGFLVPRAAVKFARIIARPGIEGEEITTWSVDKEGNPIVEKVDNVTRDSETNETGWVVIKANEACEAIVDANGHINEWIIGAPTFHKKYEESEVPSLYKPKGGQQLFVELPINVIVEQWGKTMKIAAGGYLNVTDFDDVYGISKRDFEDTYKFVEEPSQKKILS